MKKIMIIVFVLLTAIVSVFLVLPWKAWLAQQIIAQMQAQGMKIVSLSVAGITPDKIILKDIVLGEKAGLKLQTLAIDYDPMTFFSSGKFKNLSFADLKLNIREENGVWSLNGAQGSGNMKIPDTSDSVEAIVADRINIENAAVELVSGFWTLSFPMSFSWDKAEKRAELKSDSLSFKHHDLHFKSGELKAHIQFTDSAWKGEWSLSGIEIKDVPIISATGKIEVKGQNLTVTANLKAPENQGDAAFKVTYAFDKEDSFAVEMANADITWGGGHIKSAGVKIPTDGKKNLRAVLDIENISVDSVLDLMAGQDVTATGTMSGKVPLIITPTGQISLEPGSMAANQVGKISLPASVIPGAGEQIEMTRKILSDFEYDGLSVDVKNEGKDTVILGLTLSGNNPQVYDGRAVKLNVRLGGDVLEFLQSNFLMFTNPQSLIGQENK